ITASHNPPQYNGIKVIIGDGIEAPKEVEEVIEDYYFSLRFKRVEWRYVLNQVYSVHDVNDFYVRGVLKLVDKDLISKRGFKVVADLANNVSSLTTPKLLRELGVKVLTINGDMSHEPYRTPEPSRESLSDLYKVVTAVSADLGLAHDGDADRVIFVDELGNFIPGDYSATVLARYLVERDKDSPKRVVTAVSSSIVIEEVLKPLGVEVVWTKVGSIGIARLMKRIGALCGFEENGGFMYPKHQYVRDGAMTTALMLEYLAKERTTLSKALSTIPKYYLIKTKVPMDRERAFRMVEKVKEVYSKHKYIDIDGVKVFEKDYWFLVRPSGTEPLLRVIVEGRTKGIAEKVLSELMKLIKEGG
ncbi:MAG: phosphoglucosamine mutase, partial [Thermoprotei archaeon]